MDKEHLEKLKHILQKEKEIFEEINKECDKLRMIGKENDEEYALFRYKKEAKRLKMSVKDFSDQYDRKNKVLKEIVEREDLKQSFKIIK